MSDPTIDPWDEQRLLAVRFAGTTYAAAITVVTAVFKTSEPGPHLDPFLTKLGVWSLMLGLIGCVLFQFVFIGTKGKHVPWFAYPLLGMIGIGAAGFLSLGLAVTI